MTVLRDAKNQRMLPNGRCQERLMGKHSFCSASFLYQRGYLPRSGSNVTERQQLKLALRKGAALSKQRDTLQDFVERNQELEQYAYIISHDKRACANVAGLSQVLEASLEDSSGKRYVQ